MVQTPKIGPDNSIYRGSEGGTFYKVTPPAVTDPPSGVATQVFAFAATGSAQTGGAASGVASGALFKFRGEAVLDSTGNAYVASTDSNPNTNVQNLGTVYKLGPTGSVLWKKPFQ